jgi:transcriptional regulator with XRE-family HTH domain
MKSWTDLRAELNLDEEKVSEASTQLETRIHAYRLKELRKELQITQVELAQQLHVSQNRISRIEQGDIEKSQVDTLRKYVEAMGGTLRIDVEVDGKKFQLA